MNAPIANPDAMAGFSARICSAWAWCVDFAGCLLLFCLPLLIVFVFALVVALLASPFTILRKMNIEI